MKQNLSREDACWTGSWFGLPFRDRSTPPWTDKESVHATGKSATASSPQASFCSAQNSSPSFFSTPILPFSSTSSSSFVTSTTPSSSAAISAAAAAAAPYSAAARILNSNSTPVPSEKQQRQPSPPTISPEAVYRGSDAALARLYCRKKSSNSGVQNVPSDDRFFFFFTAASTKKKTPEQHLLEDSGAADVMASDPLSPSASWLLARPQRRETSFPSFDTQQSKNSSHRTLYAKGQGAAVVKSSGCSRSSPDLESLTSIAEEAEKKRPCWLPLVYSADSLHTISHNYYEKKPQQKDSINMKRHPTSSSFRMQSPLSLSAPTTAAPTTAGALAESLFSEPLKKKAQAPHEATTTTTTTITTTNTKPNVHGSFRKSNNSNSCMLSNNCTRRSNSSNSKKSHHDLVDLLFSEKFGTACSATSSTNTTAAPPLPLDCNWNSSSLAQPLQQHLRFLLGNFEQVSDSSHNQKTQQQQLLVQVPQQKQALLSGASAVKQQTCEPMSTLRPQRKLLPLSAAATAVDQAEQTAATAACPQSSPQTSLSNGLGKDAFVSLLEKQALSSAARKDDYRPQREMSGSSAIMTEFSRLPAKPESDVLTYNGASIDDEKMFLAAARERALFLQRSYTRKAVDAYRFFTTKIQFQLQQLREREARLQDLRLQQKQRSESLLQKLKVPPSPPIWPLVPFYGRLLRKSPMHCDEEEVQAARSIFLDSNKEMALIEKFNISMTSAELECLCGSNWLNDEVINFYMQMLQERNRRQRAMGQNIWKVFVFNTFFYAKLLRNGGYDYASVRRWTKRQNVDVFAVDLLLIPLHVNQLHWTLGVLDMRKSSRRICFFDSLNGTNKLWFTTMKRYLQDEHLDKHGVPLEDVEEWFVPEDFRSEPYTPRQENGFDCGVFICQMAECITDGRAFDFSQEQISRIRCKMALQIISGELDV